MSSKCKVIIGSRKCNKPIIKMTGLSYECLSCGKFTCFSHRMEHQKTCENALLKIEEERRNYEEFNTKLSEILRSKQKIRAKKFHEMFDDASKKIAELKNKTKISLSVAIRNKENYEKHPPHFIDNQTMEVFNDRLQTENDKIDESKQTYENKLHHYNTAKIQKEKILSDIRLAISIFEKKINRTEQDESNLQILKTKIKDVESYQEKIINQRYQLMRNAEQEYMKAKESYAHWTKISDKMRGMYTTQETRAKRIIQENLSLIQKYENLIEELVKYEPDIEIFHIEYKNIDSLTDIQADKLMSEYCKKIPSTIRELVDIRF